MRGESSVIKNVQWTERYRPTELSQVALDESTRRTIDEYLAAGEIPHLLFIGPAGSGKTTVARILFGAIDTSVLELNASAERGIDTIRNKVSEFAGSMLGTEWNTVFLDEADALTSDAQTALRNTIETFAERTRFILTCNYGHRIIDAIHSRCQVMEFGRPPLKERFRILAGILESEGISADKPTILGYAEHFPDMRKMLFAAQKAWLSSGKGVLPPAQAQSSVTGAQLWRDLQQLSWKSFTRYTTAPDFDVQNALRELFWAIPVDHAKAGQLRIAVARGVHESGFSPDIVILFLGVIDQCIEIISAQ